MSRRPARLLLLGTVVLASCAPAPSSSNDPPPTPVQAFAGTRPDSLRLEARARSAGVNIVDPESPLTQHLHTELRIVVDGERIVVPAGIGIDGEMIAALHTHDTSNQVHVESDTTARYTLAQFLELWGLDATTAGLCEAFFASRACNLEVGATGTEPAGLDTAFADGASITLTLSPAAV